MDAGLSVALSESYCYVAADHIALRVPVVTSGAVRCADAGSCESRIPGASTTWPSASVSRSSAQELARAAAASLFARATENVEQARSALAQLRSLAGVPA
jgi:hypothetical protein